MPSTAAAVVPSKCITDSAVRNDTSVFPEFQSLGVRTWTTQLSWRDIAQTRPVSPRDPNDPAYLWPANLDQALSDAGAHHVETVLFVMNTPGWANGGREHMWSPNDVGDYADFVAAAALKYPSVRRWQVWSEPTKGSNFRPQGKRGKAAPLRYAQLLDAAWVSLHQVRRDVVVIGGNLHPVGFNDQNSTSPATFLANMKMPNGRRPRLDMFGMNPYTQRRPSIRANRQSYVVDLNDLDWLLGNLDHIYPHKHLRLFIGEFGYQTDHGNAEWFDSVSRGKQAQYLTDAYGIARKLRRVDTFCWFLLDDMTPQVQNGVHLDWTTGLMDSQGIAKQALKAFQSVPNGPSRI